jgi:hypothetical protein
MLLTASRSIDLQLSTNCKKKFQFDHHQREERLEAYFPLRELNAILHALNAPRKAQTNSNALAQADRITAESLLVELFKGTLQF